MLLHYLLQRKKIRNKIRYLRRSFIDRNELLANLLAEYAMNFPPISKAQNITIFYSIDGEINTYPLINRLWKEKKNVFLPKIGSFISKKTFFLKYIPNMNLKINKFYIPEPLMDNKNIISLDKIDVMLVPLVAFNSKGQRLGMGGGFYDSILQTWKQNKFLPIGLAYDFQLIDEFPIANWDVPLPIILTPSTFWCFINLQKVL